MSALEMGAPKLPKRRLTANKAHAKSLTKEFEWSYAITALPAPVGWSVSGKAQQLSDNAVERNLLLAFREISRAQGPQSYFAWTLEGVGTDCRKAHVLLGAISGVDPTEIRRMFQSHQFENVVINPWESRRGSGSDKDLDDWAGHGRYSGMRLETSVR
jgi:hypothetical protein